MSDKYQTIVDGVFGNATPSTNSNAPEKNGNLGTFYGGLKVTQDIKEQLESQSVSNFLSFSPSKNNDGTFYVQGKLPEKGCDKNGNEYSIRKNINIILKTMTNAFIKDNAIYTKDISTAIFDILPKIAENPNALTNSYPFENILNQLSDSEKDDFMHFINDPEMYKPLNSMLLNFDKEMQSIVGYNYAIQNIDKYEKTDEVEKYLAQSYNDYRNIINRYFQISKMDPETETRVFLPSDCTTYADTNIKFMASVLRLSQKQNNQPITATGNPPTDKKTKEGSIVQSNASNDYTDVKKVDLNMEKMPEDSNDNAYRAFDVHACTCFEVTVNNEKKIISLETTAPQGNKLLFQPCETKAGIGIYNDIDELYTHYVNNNMVTIDDFPLLKNLKSTDISDISPISNQYFIDVKKLKTTKDDDIFEAITNIKFNNLSNYFDVLDKMYINGVKITQQLGINKDSTSSEYKAFATDLKKLLNGLENGNKSVKIARETNDGIEAINLISTEKNNKLSKVALDEYNAKIKTSIDFTNKLSDKERAELGSLANLINKQTSEKHQLIEQNKATYDKFLKELNKIEKDAEKFAKSKDEKYKQLLLDVEVRDDTLYTKYRKIRHIATLEKLAKNKRVPELERSLFDAKSKELREKVEKNHIENKNYYLEQQKKELMKKYRSELGNIFAKDNIIDANKKFYKTLKARYKDDATQRENNIQSQKVKNINLSDVAENSNTPKQVSAVTQNQPNLDKKNLSK